MDLRELILRIAREQPTFKTSDVVQRMPRRISRQYVTRVLTKLVREGQLIRGGATRGAFYALPERVRELGLTVSLELRNEALREEEVLDELRRRVPSLLDLKRNVDEVVSYAFTEMLNNAIEHSGSKRIRVEMRRIHGDVAFVVEDFGIGVFRNVMQKRNLNSELEAIQDLLKGKTTTSPEAHTGEGIFFTSRAADLFVLDSFKHRLRIDNRISDVFVEEVKPAKRGSRVTFTIAERSNRRLAEVFQRYTTEPAEPEFDKSEIKVRVYSSATRYISRAEARRMLSGLEHFRTLILDFEHVPTIGQGFADEVFRVFRQHHPDIALRPVNMNDSVRFMVERAGMRTDRGET